ncbi:MAG: prepilin-type N-terminal cleavage/methylation domain-containing protein [bacterium]|nr:prepilin-type N-terminal cleavage/methylation domain-containing protein [bacterium]
MKNAFTLIELLVVTAVIGILVSIAAPNFMSAQTRAKIARAQSDLRLLSQCIELYRLDSGNVPFTDGPFAPGYFERLRPLTTPVAYIGAPPTDPFQPMLHPFLFSEDEAERWENRMYIYNRSDAENGASHGADNHPAGFAWSLASVGPDHRLHYPYYFFPEGFVRPEWYRYDASNGLSSGGEIFRRSVNAKAH